MCLCYMCCVNVCCLSNMHIWLLCELIANKEFEFEFEFEFESMLCLEVNIDYLDENYGENWTRREIIQCIACFDQMWMTLKWCRSCPT